MVDKALKLATANGVYIEGRTMNARQLEFPDNAFDIVFAANLLHHLPEPTTALREIHRVLKPGGKLCFSDPLRHNPVMATLWIFVRFYLIERIDPNERDWKRIIPEQRQLERTYRRLEGLDRLLKQLPFIKRFAWTIAVVATK